PTFDLDGTGTANVASVALGAGETNNDVDFGYRGDGAIGDTIWRDDNGNGVQDGTEPGLGGVTVTLRDSSNNVVGTAVTDGNGNYSFPNLPPDTYTVTVDPSTLPAGVSVPTFDLDGTGTPNVAAVTIGAGETNNDVDFGYQEEVVLGSIGDRVWEDLNGDGSQDVGEVGINNVTVNLLDGGAIVIDTQVTSGDGNYLFSGLPAGSYTVVVDATTLPGGLAQTFDLDGLATANQASLVLGDGENNALVDFGYGPCGECDGKVTELTLQYLGSSAANIEVVARRGPTTDTVFTGTLNPGDTFDLVGPQTGNGGFFGTLGTEIRIFVDGVHQTTIHTSCSVPVGPGLISGDFKVLAGASRHGGLLCPVDDPGGPGDDCGCEGKVASLKMQYTGATTAFIEVVGQGGPNTETLFSGNVAPGGMFDVTSFTTANPGFEGTVGTEIDLFVNGVLQTTIHTSCSQPIGPGLVSGDFLVLGGFSRDFDGPLCPVEGDGTEYCVSPAEGDVFNSGSGGHALWLPGISQELIFDGGGGTFVQNSDGTASLTGTLSDEADSSKQFLVSVQFTGLTFITPPGSPKKELDPNAYSENGGPVDTDSWVYYTGFTGSLIGAGSWAGAEVTFSLTGSAFQLGVGANGKNVNFGGSGWFDWSVTSQPSGGGFPSTGRGDINIDLNVGACPDGGGCPDDLDFEIDASGNGLVRGQIIDDEFASLGIHITTNDPTNHPAMIFDSGNPTGGDLDLGTPHQDFGGPGIGAGGASGQAGQNNLPLGKLLIISEDGDQGDPDDNAGGGDFIFTFDSPVEIASVTLVDIDLNEPAAVEVFDENGSLISQAGMLALGDNSVQVVEVAAAGVRRLEIHFPSSGAVAGISFGGDCPGGGGGGGDCTPGKVRDDFDTVSFSNNDGPDDWSGDWVENDPAGPGPNSGRVYMQPGFLFLNDAPDTGGEPSVAREVDMEGAASANLRFKFDTGSGVDASDAITVEISNNGGATWTTLEVITGINGTITGSRDFDITSHISANTQVRFRVTNLYGGDHEFFCLQWVEITWTCDDEPDPLGSISGTVWDDANGNGQQDDPSAGLGGVTVKLKQGSTVLDTTTTDGNGDYTFGDLEAGDYTVKVTASSLPDGIDNPTYDLDGTGTAHRADVSLSSGQDRNDADFGYQGSTTCSYCDHYTGSLWDAGDYEWEPDGTYYWSGAGTQEGWLEGAAGSDFDLYLYKWNGSAWEVVASSYSDATSSEHISYNGSEGHYMWLVYNYSGSGDYDLWLDHP
nr:carboxypeptidase regulatory-like domain-containing protein [Deltaproteobacteria bacterium]